MPQTSPADDTNDTAVLLGALAPLSRPGWVEAGQHLIAGLEMAVDDVNAAGGIHGRPLRLLVRDTAADPQRAAAAVDALAGLGVAALVGEFHSVVARAVAARADALQLPFLCSSAVIDSLTEHPSPWVARLPPAQSYGWRTYADFLIRTGHRRIALAMDASVYWASGARILEDALGPHGCDIRRLESLAPASVCDALAASGATALLLLTGVPEPAVPIVRAVRNDPRLAGCMIGAPAGQPELADWMDALGRDGAAIPFLRYLPERLGALATRVQARLIQRRGVAPSFVAFEGYDSALVLADMLRAHGVQRCAMADAWAQVSVDGTRGTIRFSRMPGISAWQWAWPPVQVAERDPDRLDRCRVLHAIEATDA